MKKSLYAAGLIIAVLIAISGWLISTYTSEGPLEQPTTIVFEPNTHFTTIADMLAEQSVIRHPFIFKVTLFLTGQSSHIKAGEYRFMPHISARETAQLLASGKGLIHHLTVPEGLTTYEILDMLKHNDLLAGEITLAPKEGELLPETYNFTRGEKRNDLILRMQHAMEKALAEAWEQRAPDLPFTSPEQALTLASIVEKETGLDTERAHVAAVYINRLKKGMLLQADPTTAYAVSHGKGKMTRALNRKDLEMASPYNTYRSAGLPPGPIANPGKASILATLHPLQSEDIYFVATGIGGHNFARTAAEHERNVKKYLENLRSK
ncbi:MAG TPA: endolytic transglycosylase MltG [Rickettsiales bacterium]|nr:endolytic transglycosylase MltG [Rickettsiales bacterium]